MWVVAGTPRHNHFGHDVVLPGHEREKADVIVREQCHGHLQLRARVAVEPHQERVHLAPAAEGGHNRDAHNTVGHELLATPTHRPPRAAHHFGDRSPAGPPVVLQGNDDLAVKPVECIECLYTIVHDRGGTTWCRKPGTVAVQSSASSICGECPDFSKITSCASGMSAVIVSLHETGVIQSVRPTVTRVGTLIPGSIPFKL